MGRAIALASASTVGAAGAALSTLATSLAKGWLEVTALLFDGYRPERHYMRGPGPAWHAKHGSRRPG